MFSLNIITILLGGAIITTLVNLVKAKFPKTNVQIIVAGMSLLIGVVYQLFSSLVPEPLKVSIVSFIVEAGASAVLIYEFIWKNLIKK
jgi:predicted membrane channel-forming protein YqfA (hemolysin III family)